MRRSQTAAMLALGVLSLSARRAAAQATIEPASPRWGESITITVEPNRGAKEGERADPSEQLYVVLSPVRQGSHLSRFERPWTSMTWDGRRFVARMTVPYGCETGSVSAATAERMIDGTTAFFICRATDGRLPPGALISALMGPGRDKPNWKAEVEEDLAALRTTSDHGWEYLIVWQYRVLNERSTFTRQEILREVERVDREETRRTPGLLFSLFRGYDVAGEGEKAFERLRELCDRYPESELTPRDALRLAGATVLRHPELQPELGRLFAQVADRAPQNKGLREALPTLVTNVPAVPLSTIREVVTRWLRDQADRMAPYYFLAAALSSSSGASDQQSEAETLVSKAIELALRPRPFDLDEQRLMSRAFALRSRLRAAHGDLVGALADTHMAQLVAKDKAGADDLAVEAGLWQRLGYGGRAEALAVDAFRLGSPRAEALLKKTYVARTGGDAGFDEYLIARLRERNASPGPALRPMPSFSGTTLDGAAIDPSALVGRVTVLDFWFIACPPCRVERPKLNEIVSAFGDRVRFVSFALDSAEALKKYLTSDPFKYEVVPDSEAIAKAFGVDSMPTHMVIDRAGQIVWLSGSDDDRIERLRAVIIRMLASDAK
jgi:thiol-disulfide isomerase/thioredoxin